MYRLGPFKRRHHCRLHVESLEARLPMTAETFLVNFQLAGTTAPTRYLTDVGEVFGDRGLGNAYGWSSDHTDVSRDRGINADQRLDTLIHFHRFQNWEFALSAGEYAVTVSIGDAEFGSSHTLNVEGMNFWNGVDLNPGEFLTQTANVTVNDGRLTLDQGAAIEKATRINYIQIVNLPSVPNNPPAEPTILEPVAGRTDINPTDAHMEAVGFSDLDGDTHFSSDWQIWTVGGGAQAVWETLGIQGVERLHTHLGDGTFMGSHAGRTDLLPNTQYELRVRFRDSAASTSGYSVRPFATGSASTIYPKEVTDVATLPVPQWRFSSGARVLLHNASTPDELRLESVSGALLLSVAGNDGLTNTVTNPPALADHQPVRLVIEAGSQPLSLTPTELNFSDETGRQHTIYLPAIALNAGERIDLWVDAGCSTYYGDASQSQPDFSSLARSAPLAAPFVATQPGFVVETVAEGFQLPVNVAFVPAPGPNPSDPLFYVAELYGSIKVVSNNGDIGDYATGLLNFNPTGNFPGSGEQGLAGIVVDPVSGDVVVTRVTSLIPFDDNAPHHPQVVRLSSNDGGLTAATETIILDMPGESQGQSHQISNVSIGPDGNLYVHNGDGFNAATAQNLDSYRGKVLRMDLNGNPLTDNPFYNASNGINSRDYVFAYGLRNPFGGAWRASDGMHYQVENGPSVDRFSRVEEGVNYLWDGSDASMFNRAIYNWNPAMHR